MCLVIRGCVKVYLDKLQGRLWHLFGWKRTLETNWFEMCSPKLIKWAEELKNIFFTRRCLCLRYASTSCFNCFGTSSKSSRRACFPETPTSAYTPTHGVLQLKLSSFDSLSIQSLPDGLHTFPSWKSVRYTSLLYGDQIWTNLNKRILPESTTTLFPHISIHALSVGFRHAIIFFHWEEVFSPDQFFDGGHLINATTKSAVRRDRVDVYLSEITLVTRFSDKIWKILILKKS